MIRPAPEKLAVGFDWPFQRRHLTRLGRALVCKNALIARLGEKTNWEVFTPGLHIRFSKLDGGERRLDVWPRGQNKVMSLAWDLDGGEELISWRGKTAFEDEIIHACIHCDFHERRDAA